ncbi:MAG: SH3 domain-containing protein, partial [Prevotellaceae bacterium]|jgi:exosortase/archaeosortase|nr:SH3 domain-containing protein [Prevotellaceae bacterium]
LAQSKITDQIAGNESFFSNFWNVRVASLMSANGWAWLSVLGFCAVLLCVFAFFFGNQIWRQVSFFAFFALLVLSVAAFLLAKQQSAKITERNSAIIMAQSISVKSSPDAAGTDLFILHEGTKVQIQTSLGDWVEIRLADGKIGWLPVEVMERI